MSLLEKLKKNNKLTGSDILSDSKFFTDIDITPTDIPALNIALSGEIDGGLSSGITLVCAPSRHFKSNITLLLVSAYLKKNADAAVLFYDSEFGTPESYFASLGVDPSKVWHAPVKNLEEFTFDIMAQLEGITRDDKLIIIVDSLGGLASKKEVDDALTENSALDMSRQKKLKSVFRMVTPYIAMNNIPMICIGHVYQTLEKFPKTVISGGSGMLLAANNALIIGRKQDKDEDGLNGYNFVLNVEKSRFVKEKSKIDLQVSFNEGIEKYSGLLELALEGGFIIKPKMGWYQVCDPVTKIPLGGSLREADTYSSSVWEPLLKSKEFKEFVKNKFKLAQVKMLQEESISDELEVKPAKSFKEKMGLVPLKLTKDDEV